MRACRHLVLQLAPLIALTGTIQLSSVDAKHVRESFVHSKLIDDEHFRSSHLLDPRRRDGYIFVLNNDFFFRNIDMNVELIGQNIMKDVEGGTIDFIYTNIFQGFSVSNVTQHSIKLLLDNDAIRFAVRNTKITLESIDQEYPPWGLDRIDQSTNDLNQRYTSAWDGSGVTIFIVDSGIRNTHREFGNRVVCAFSAYAAGDPCSDSAGHGTHVAGIAAGLRYGVAKNATLASVRVFGSGKRTGLARILAGLDYIVGIKKNEPPGTPMVVNMSLGGIRNTLFNIAVAAMVDAGLVVTAAAGNSNRNACLYSPASSDRVITVGSTTRDDEKSPFSNVGSCVDIFAPGSSIESSYIYDDYSVAIFSGTSMAAPFVAGAVALIFQKHGIMTPDEVKQIIRDNAIKDTIQFEVNRRSPNLFLNIQNL